MKELSNYINDPENDLNNFNLGLFYEQQNHYSPASGYYLRCAEKTKNLDLRYESLLRMYYCFKLLGDRDHTCDSLLKQAICLCPQKPEGYFLLTQHYESKSDWLNVYTYSSIALDVCKDASSFISDIDYAGLYCLLFQKAAASWWIGKPKQCRQLYQTLLNEYINQLSDNYKALLENNLSRIASGPTSQAIRRYTKNLKDTLRFSFDDVDIIEENYSQVYQDMFVLTILNGKKNGTYLEIGSAEPFKNSNTALLEKKFSWKGIGIELNENFVKQHKEHRSNPVLPVDVLIIDYNKLLNKYFPDTDTIDYLQLDIEPPRNTFQALLAIPFDKYKFSIITYEHDYYVDVSRSYRDKSREYLSSLGYILVVSNVSPDKNSPFEDWWIHPELLCQINNYSLINTFNNQNINFIEDVMLKKNNKLNALHNINFISIEESFDRQENLKKQFLDYNITNFTPNIFKRYQEYNYKLHGDLVSTLHENSKGPVTSHIKSIKRWYDLTNEEYGFFCEDDLSLETVPYWNFTFQEFIDNLPEDWECVQLTCVRPNPIGIKLRERLDDDWNAAAYLIKRNYAKKIIDNYYVNDNEFNLKINNTNQIPIVENILFSNIGKVYNFPIFIEDIVNTKSTCLANDLVEENGQGPYHWDSYYWVINWWKQFGQYLTIQELMKKFSHIYQQNQFGENWFTYPDLYRSMVEKFPSGSKFVEVGSWKGKSSAYMAVEIANSNKKIDFYCVDTWAGSDEHKDLDTTNIYEIFMNNMKPLEKYYKSIKSLSVEVAKQFEDNSLDFVFIDASHDYEDVKNDILVWLPKIKQNGILAGHDYYVDQIDYFPGVKRAVNEILKNIKTQENCFIYEKI